MGDLRYYGSQTEDILFCRKGDHILRWNGRSGNIWSSSSSSYLPEGQLDHPTQKAEKIIRRMIYNSSDRGAVVADFHMGSGTTAVVAHQAGRHYFGCDINPDYVEMGRKRVAAVQLAMQLW
jgi:DNA modification methylase